LHFSLALPGGDLGYNIPDEHLLGAIEAAGIAEGYAAANQ